MGNGRAWGTVVAGPSCKSACDQLLGRGPREDHRPTHRIPRNLRGRGTRDGSDSVRSRCAREESPNCLPEIVLRQSNWLRSAYRPSGVGEDQNGVNGEEISFPGSKRTRAFTTWEGESARRLQLPYRQVGSFGFAMQGAKLATGFIRRVSISVSTGLRRGLGAISAGGSVRATRSMASFWRMALFVAATSARKSSRAPVGNRRSRRIVKERGEGRDHQHHREIRGFWSYEIVPDVFLGSQ